MPTINPRIKDAIFYGVFALLLILYVVIVWGAFNGWLDASAAVMATISSMAPIILSDLSLAGEVGPFVLGGIMAWTAPRRTSNWQTVTIILLSALVWLAYLHMQVFFSESYVKFVLDNGTDMPDEDILTALPTLQTFSASVRTFAAVVMAAILGLRFNDNVPAFMANGQPEPALPGAAGVIAPVVAVPVAAAAAAPAPAVADPVVTAEAGPSEPAATPVEKAPKPKRPPRRTTAAKARPTTKPKTKPKTRGSGP